MTKWKIRYMVDPGDGLVSETVVSGSDDIIEIATDFYNENNYFIIGMEIVDHPLMVGEENDQAEVPG